jgi:hypothetical protein
MEAGRPQQGEIEMTSIHIERLIDAPAEQAWEAIRDVGALHTRLVPGAIVDTVLEEDARIVTFADGLVLREVLVDLDDARRRFVYSIRSEKLTHHNGANQILDEGNGRCRFVWVVDVLPDTAADTIRGMMNNSADIVKATLEAAARR